ncbi:TonB-dependent receptor [Pyrinomonas methylaliphatogenes]|uniref:Carboxypeptidase regulatory-like domain n=1 Tax=Pyrinomonas methylaliphatogenes TaxID=454194 RepID=A0A0B6WX47_9BACT|nr:carboxypeptidase-like regulatory domain-containing protein [Pyrinomonas methylaliphatogenes]CDM64869.1 Carboxypeptidase regulatory-like domain [Pyrinomonas methylaliphatogenes]
MSKKILWRCVLIAFCSVLSSAVGWGQGTTSRVTGTVLDPSGAAVPNATVTLINEATNVSFTTQTTDTGTYVFDSVQVGTYTVTVEKPGFKKFVSPGNKVNVNQPTTVDVRLEVGGVNETVTVESAAELVQTSTSGNFGNTVEERPLESLPIVGVRGRNPLNFVNFQPGVVVGANTGGGVHVHGSRDRAFNFTLDGIDINETSAGGSNFTPLRPNPDSITQFQVITSNFTAELGRSSGAQVLLVTRSGTNEFHGNLFEFYQTPRFHANDYQNTVTLTRKPDGSFGPTPKQKFVQHIFGGSLGGPVYFPRFGEGGPAVYNGKDRTFFFVNLQLLRTSQSIFVNRTVYTEPARRGIYRYVIGGQNANAAAARPSVDFNGNPLPGLQIGTFNIFNNPNIPLTPDPTTQRLIGLTPLPNNFIVGDGLNTAGFAFVAPQIERQYDFTAKIDHTFNDRHTMFVRWAQGAQNTFGDNANGGLQRFPGLPNFVDTFRTPRNLAVNYRATLTPLMVNELVVGFNRFTFSFNNPDPNADRNSPVILNLVTDPLNATPTVNNARTLTTYQVVDNFSYLRGSHTIKFGVNLRFQKHFDDRSSVAGVNIRESVTLGTGDNPVPASFGTRSIPTGSNGINLTDRSRLESYINDIFGRVGRITQGFVAVSDNAFGPPGTRFLYTAEYPEHDFYGQDTWKVRPNLTIDYGLRWEVRLSPRAPHNIILRPDRPVRVGASPTNEIRFVEGKLYDDAWKNLAPTVGVAWDPFGTGKTAVRANYRLAYDRTNTFVFSSFIFQSAPGLTRAVTLTASDPRWTPTSRLLRDGLPQLTGDFPATSGGAPVTPLAFRTPPPFSLNSITVVDPSLGYPRTHQFGISFQREIGWGTVLSVNYIGNRGRKLYGGYDANQVEIFSNGFLEAFKQLQNPATRASVATDPNFLINRLLAGDSRLQSGETGAQFLLRQSAGGNVPLANGQVATNIVDAGSVAQAAFIIAQGIKTGTSTPVYVANGFSPFFFQPFPQFSGAVNVIDNNDRSRYNALEIQLSRRFNRGLGFQVSYTLAKSMDTRSFDPAFAVANRGNVQSASNTPYDIRNRQLNWARSDFDRRHALQGYFTAELPFGRGRRYLNDLSPMLDRIVGGFELAGVLQWFSGRPFTVYSGVNTVSQVVQSPASCNGCSPDMGRIIVEGGQNYFLSADQRAKFYAPPAGELGNTGRNFFTGPPLFQLDMVLGKRIRFDEVRNLELRVEAQNVTNTPSFDLPNAVISSPSFGFVGGSVVSTSRRVQLAAKFHF